MIALLLAIQVAPPPPAPESDIVVIGRRVRDWRGTFKAGPEGVTRECTTRRSTGDAEIDAIGCEATVACYMEHHGKIAAIMNETRSRKTANRRIAAVMQAEMTPCLDRSYEPLVAALAAKRREAGGAR